MLLYSGLISLWLILQRVLWMGFLYTIGGYLTDTKKLKDVFMITSNQPSELQKCL